MIPYSKAPYDMTFYDLNYIIWPHPIHDKIFDFLILPSDSDDFELEADQSQLNCYDYLELVIFSTNQTTEICGNSYDQEFGSKHILGSD